MALFIYQVAETTCPKRSKHMVTMLTVGLVVAAWVPARKVASAIAGAL